MLYPTINQYIDTLTDAKNYSHSLGALEFCTTITGEPIYYSGNYGVVFKILLEGKTLALKCFTRHQAGRAEAYEKLCAQLPHCPYLVDIAFLRGELLVATSLNDLLQPFDAVTMDFVGGQTLEQALLNATHKADRLTLTALSENFDRLALWLLEQDFAHGDIKPTNIMVLPDNSLQLVDYDGIYLPSMEGEAQREVGTEAYQHPLRGQMSFTKSIDDYSIALISLVLRALAQRPELIKSPNSGRGELLIHPADAVGGSSSILEQIEISGLVDKQLIDCVRSQTPKIEGLTSILRHREKKVPTHRVEPRSDDPAQEWEFVDTDKMAAIARAYDKVWEFGREGLALVKARGKYGFVGCKGRVAIKLRFDYAAPFCEGLAVAAVDGKYGYIDTKGRWAIAAQYDFARSVHHGVAEVEIDGASRQITVK